MKYGLIGNNISYSYSKQIHERLSKYTYDICSISSYDMNNLLKSKDFNGINVTIPYKYDVIKYLDEKSKEVLETQSCNLVINNENKLIGYNTDYFGFIETLKFNHIDTIVNRYKVLILGTGATSRTINCALKYLGCKSITYASRNKSYSNDIYTYEEINKRVNRFDMVINSTPVGTINHNSIHLLNINKIKGIKVIMDVVYNPLYTNLLAYGKMNNIKVINGLYMLISQALYSASLFANTIYDEQTVRKVYYEHVTKNSNIVLIGLPASGKSTLSKYLAKMLNRTYYSIDDMIEKSLKMTIPEIFNKYGEEYFRKKEKEIIYSLKHIKNCVIDTGGGSILDRSNVINLLTNGIMIYVKRDISKCYTNSNRPLLKSRDDLLELYNKRHLLYERYADITINNNGRVNACFVNKVLERINKYIKGE